MHIQKVFIILAFNESLIEAVVSNLNRLPYIGPKLEGPFKELLVKQKAKLHRKSGQSETVSDPSVLGWIFEKFVLAMILYFVVSIVNSLAQSYHKRLHKRKTTAKQHWIDMWSNSENVFVWIKQAFFDKVNDFVHF